jgi:hypothetical protein
MPARFTLQQQQQQQKQQLAKSVRQEEGVQFIAWHAPHNFNQQSITPMLLLHPWHISSVPHA